jgi:putative SOS response-associated peptidase YedK
MCARFSLTKDELTILIGEIEIIISLVARYNIAPAQKAPVIVPSRKGYHSVEMLWGWKPVWSKQLLINAQAETILEKPTFKKHIGNRCLVPADGFYEWTPDKTPIRFTQPKDAVFCFAGLWYESTTQPQDVSITEQHFIIITTTPNKTVGKIHNRMPFIVQEDQYDWWLRDGNMFESVLQFPDKAELNYCPVQRELNNVRNEGAELIRPAPMQNKIL